jgi:hypothetical protein
MSKKVAKIWNQSSRQGGTFDAVASTVKPRLQMASMPTTRREIRSTRGETQRLED